MIDLPHLVFDGARNWEVLEDKSSRLERILKKVGELCLKPADYIIMGVVRYGKTIDKSLSWKPKDKVNVNYIAGRCWEMFGLV